MPWLLLLQLLRDPSFACMCFISISKQLCGRAWLTVFQLWSFPLCSLLLARSWRQATRDKATNVARAGTNISSAIIFGSIYFRMRRTQSTIQDRIGLLQVSDLGVSGCPSGGSLPALLQQVVFHLGLQA